MTALAVALAVVAAVYVPMLATGTRVSDSDDFLLIAAHQESLRQSVFRHGAFPLWFPYFGGGYPLIGEPENSALNPLAWLTMPLPTPMALKVRMFLVAAAAAAGTWLLARFSMGGYTRWAAAFSAIVFPLAFWLPWEIESGNVCEGYPGLVPLCLFLLLSAPRRPWRFFWLVLVLYTMLSDGKQTFFASLLFMGMLCLAWGAVGRLTRAKPGAFRPLVYLFVAVAFTALIGMVKTLPTLELVYRKGSLTSMALIYSEAPRSTIDFHGLSLSLPGLRGVEPDYHGLHPGFLPLVCFGLGLVFSWRKALPWAACAFALAWLALGANAPVDVLSLLTSLPIYSALDKPAKYFAPLISLCVCMGAGAFLSAIRPALSRWAAPAMALAATALSVAALAPHAARMAADPWTSAAPERIEGADGFYSVKGRGLLRNRAKPYQANTYYNLMRGVGTVDWYTSIPLPEHAQPRFFIDSSGRRSHNPKYRGEAHFARPENRSQAQFQPNRIVAQVDLCAPDFLTINQNYSPSWRADRGRLFEKAGLLAVALDRPGQYAVTLRYVPMAFWWGLVVSACGVVLLLAFVLARVWGKLRILGERPEEGADAHVAWPSRTCETEGSGTGRAPVWAAAVAVVAAGVAPLVAPGFINWRAYHALRTGNEYHLRGEKDEAEKRYRQALRADSRNLLALYRLARTLEERDEHAEAVERFRALLKLNPSRQIRMDALNGLAIGLEMLGEVEAANAALGEVLKLDPKADVRVGARYRRGLCSLRLGRTKAATEEFARMLAPRAEFDRVVAERMAAGHYSPARVLLNAGLQARPNDADLLRRLAWLLATCPDESLRKPKRALRLAKRVARAKGKPSAVDLDVLAAALATAGRCDEAVGVAEKALKLAKAQSPNAAAAIAKRLSLYRSGRPFRLSAPKDSPETPWYYLAPR